MLKRVLGRDGFLGPVGHDFAVIDAASQMNSAIREGKARCPPWIRAGKKAVGGAPRERFIDFARCGDSSADGQSLDLYLSPSSCANFELMDSKPEVNREESLENRERASADRRDTFSDLQNVGNAIQVEDERSRQQRCKCDWDYATANGMLRAHNPLCPVHDLEPAVNAVQTNVELSRK
jgi:hypothetical protein